MLLDASSHDVKKDGVAMFRAYSHIALSSLPFVMGTNFCVMLVSSLLLLYNLVACILNQSYIQMIFISIVA